MKADRQQALREATLRLRQQRKHHPCKKHGRIKTVCEDCLRVVCPKCGHTCKKPAMKAPVPKRRVTDKGLPYEAPTPLIPIWTELFRLGALYIDAHEDSGHWMAMFPANHLGCVTAGELADKVWADPKMKALAQPTPYRAGRLKMLWWISFKLKETK